MCGVCRYMRSHPDFKLAIMNSKYFNTLGTEEAMTVVRRYGAPFTSKRMYTHFRMHQRRERQLMIGKPATVDGVIINWDDKPEEGFHRLALDDFIRAGERKMKAGEMPVNAQTFLSAIKIKLDDESRGKDRKADIFKTMFKGAAPSGSGQSEGS